MSGRKSAQARVVQRIEALQGGIMLYQEMSAKLVRVALEALASGDRINEDWLITTTMEVVQAVHEMYMIDPL